MTKRKGGKRRKSKSKMTKPRSQQGKISLTRYFQTLNAGDSVQLDGESGVHNGPYPVDFHGRAGIVHSQIGTCYHVKVMDGNKEKTLIVHPVHLKKQNKA